MLQMIVFLIGFCLVGIVHGAVNTCQTGPYDAEKSIVGPGGGKYYLLNTTHQDEKSCLYVIPPMNGTKFPASYEFGYKENGTWEMNEGSVFGQGPHIIDEDEVFGATNTTLVYTDYRQCNVGLLSGDRIGGPHVELWKHSHAQVESEGFKCCQTAFKQELKRLGKTSGDVKLVSKGCSYPNEN
ncbi:uncharacterized protein LOC135378878 [Ornithodoros turicata]|uniref:uncharacterized protein LOC135378878 n=1 Tax=Ornithodoros turicata TaxID=34597 RepID=UPI003139F169